ncbi:cytochrome P450 6a2-like [Anopheles bellator]|uniref:cytochrome P450 6a2-like n=1 Tax=Anopheles bellator TaxID=139047 RepID=UPI002649F717|nr:cytochrome P450 6a2-like [Anopheles bellator]
MIGTTLLLAGLLYHNPIAALPVIVLVAVFYWLVWNNYRFWRNIDVPHPVPSLLTGNMGPSLMMRKHISQLASDWYNSYPHAAFVGYFKVLSPAIMVKDPVLVKNILTRDFESFASNDFMLDVGRDPLLAHDPFLVAGKAWKRSRSLLTPSFTGAKMKQLFPVMESVGDAFVAFVRRHLTQELEAKEISARFTTQNVVACTFGIDGDCFGEHESEFRLMGRRAFQASHLASVKMMLGFFMPTLANWIPVPFLLKDVDQWIRSLVAGIISKRMHGQIEEPKNDDFLKSLLHNINKHDASQTEITAHALTIFIEGFESSAAVLGFALYRLAENPEVQQKLFEQVSESLRANDGQLSYEVMQQMDFLEWVILETLRLHPPAATMHKTCTKNYIMRRLQRDSHGHELGVFVPVGTPILIPVLAIHMDPKYYPEPERFDPERFRPDRKKDQAGTVYMPFGEGPRMCLGMRFGQTQVKLGLLKLILQFRVSIGANHKPFCVDPGSFIYQAKDGLLLKFERRSEFSTV